MSKITRRAEMLHDWGTVKGAEKARLLRVLRTRLSFLKGEALKEEEEYMAELEQHRHETEEGCVYIDDPEKAMDILKKMSSASMGKQVVISHLILSPKCGGHLMTTTIPSNRELRKVDSLGGIGNAVVPILYDPKTGQVARRPIERYTQYQILISIDDKGTRIEDLVAGPVVKYSDKGYAFRSGNKWKDLLTGKTIGGIDESIAAGTVLVYDRGKEIPVESVTAGQLKRKQITFRCTNMAGINPEEVIDEMTFGACHVLANPVEVDELQEISKFSTRLGQHVAPSWDGKRISTWGLICSKLKMFNFEYQDGWAAVQEAFVLDMVNGWLKSQGSRLRFRKGSMVGLGIQCRPYMAKTEAVTYSWNYQFMFLAARGLMTAENQVVIDRRNVTEVAKWQDEYDKLFTPAKKESLLWGKLLIVTDDDGVLDMAAAGRAVQPEFMTDLNGEKATHSLERETCLNILSCSHISKGVKMATQLFPSLVGYGVENAKSEILSMQAEQLADKFSQLMDGKARPFRPSDFFSRREEVIEDEDGITVTADNGSPSIRMETALGICAPGYVRDCDQVIWHGQVDAALEGEVKKVANLNHPIAGYNYLLGIDPAADFGLKAINVLLDGEDTVEVICSAEEREGLLKRYPGASAASVSHAWNIRLKEYARRLRKLANEHASTDMVLPNGNTLVMDELLAEEIISLARGQARYGWVMLPADQGILAKHDGADKDGDHIQLITEEVVCRLAHGLVSYADVLDD